MPNRILKESICESRSLSACSFFAQDLFKRLITYADDYGRFNADTEIMLARLYPREKEYISQFDVNQALIEIAGAGKIQFYTSNPRKEVYGAFPGWENHQRIRDSKKKLPDPDDTQINDWYLRRFIPIDTKVEILERDKCKCKQCGCNLNPGALDAKTLVKLGFGTIHFDHIVPVLQGGRATMENLRALCPKCNLTRKRRFTFDEILAFAMDGEYSNKIAASCGELPPNPIQSESNPNPKSNPESNPSQREGKPRVKKTTYLDCVKLTEEEYQSAVERYGQQTTDEMIQILNDYKMASGKTYKSDYHTFSTWVHQRWLEDKAKRGAPRGGSKFEKSIGVMAEWLNEQEVK